MIIAAVVLAAVVLVAIVARRRYLVVAVEGPSMQPALAAGDRVLVRRIRASKVRAGQMVIARRPWAGQAWSDPQPGPETGQSWLIKRVAEVGSPPGTVYLLGDNSAQSWDSRQWGPCPQDRVRGVVVKVFAGR